jgi:hypothetical protein
MTYSTTPIKAALVDVNSNIVTSIIMVDSLADIVPEGFMLIPMEYAETVPDPEHEALQAILSMIDPNHKPVVKEPIERPVHIGVTRWTAEKKFHEE